jgi:hypothetical protein
LLDAAPPRPPPRFASCRRRGARAGSCWRRRRTWAFRRGPCTTSSAEEEYTRPAGLCASPGPLLGPPHRAARPRSLLPPPRRALVGAGDGGSAAVVCVDLDRFRADNDSLRWRGRRRDPCHACARLAAVPAPETPSADSEVSSSPLSSKPRRRRPHSPSPPECSTRCDAR